MRDVHEPNSPSRARLDPQPPNTASTSHPATAALRENAAQSATPTAHPRAGQVIRMRVSTKVTINAHRSAARISTAGPVARPRHGQGDRIASYHSVPSSASTTPRSSGWAGGAKSLFCGALLFRNRRCQAGNTIITPSPARENESRCPARPPACRIELQWPTPSLKLAAERVDADPRPPIQEHQRKGLKRGGRGSANHFRYFKSTKPPIRRIIPAMASRSKYFSMKTFIHGPTQ